jgi:hypothetical protein
VAVTAAFLALLLAVPAAWLLPRGSRGPASERSDGTRERAERPAIVTTEPYRENPLFLHLGRIGTSGRTTLLLSFAGDSSRVELEPVARVEDELLRAWAKGARRAEVTIGPEVTGREVGLLLGELERTDYGWDMVRPRN